MKKILLLIPFVLLSCSKDDNSSQPSQLTASDLISSTWSIESYTVGGDEFEVDECKALSKLEFTEDKIERTWSYWRDFEKTNCYAYTDEFQYRLESNNIIIENASVEHTYSFKIYDENTIIVTHSFMENDFVETYKR